MTVHIAEQVFENISQRAAVSYLRMLAQPDPNQDGRRDLRAFLQALYQAVFEQPDVFGLPVTPDFPITDEMPERTHQLAKANRLLEPVRKRIAQGLDFLRAAACLGRLEGHALVFSPEAYAGLVKQSKVGRQFLRGLEQTGLAIHQDSRQVRWSSERFPAMFPALQSLAQACQPLQPDNLARFHFARCDFGILSPGYAPDALDLFHAFPPEALARLERLHAYLEQRGYRPILQVYGIHGWDVRYQGSRKVKGTPLFQVDYQERWANPLRLFIKCAAAGRIVDRIPQQPRLLQEDFRRRANRCNSPACSWCKNRKGLGPSLLKFEDTRTSICWYVNPDIPELTDASVELIQQYVDLHEAMGRN